MALSVTYNVVNWVILSETRGGVDTIFVPDTNGSLIECRDASGNKTYSAEYWPYGEVQTETGSKTNPWGFGGLVGYLRDLGNLLYVRARHLRVDLGRWLTKDPLWPIMDAYDCLESNPTSTLDPSGLFPQSKNFPYGSNGYGGGAIPPPRSNWLTRFWTWLGQFKWGLALIGVLIAAYSCLKPILAGKSSGEICEECCKSFIASIGAIIGAFVSTLIGLLVGGFLGTLIGENACPAICSNGPDCLPADPLPGPKPRIQPPPAPTVPPGIWAW